MSKTIPLEAGKFYHIYNRGVNGCNLFYEAMNYDYFLQKYKQYMLPVVDTYAYCLLGNHFHLLISLKEDLPVAESKHEMGLHSADNVVSKCFSHFFNSYAKSINKKYNRTGALFESPFDRKVVTSDEYFTRLIWYIHSNAEKHGFVKDFRDYPYSSYHSHLSMQATKLEREACLNWFGGKEKYAQFHAEIQELNSIKDLIIEYD